MEKMTKVAHMDAAGEFETYIYLMWVCDHCHTPIDIPWPDIYGTYVTTRQLKLDGYRIEV